MKYQATVDLYTQGTQERILSGSLKLQAGQWVRCGSDKLSRYVKISGNSLWVAHPQGNPKATRERFMSLLSVSRR
jgi:hypothetical protein